MSERTYENVQVDTQHSDHNAVDATNLHDPEGEPENQHHHNQNSDVAGDCYGFWMIPAMFFPYT